MTPYQVSVWVPSARPDQAKLIKLFGTYADCDDEALRTVADTMPPEWQVDRITGVLSRFEAEILDLVPGEVRELPLSR
ncbi:hypothetical protein HCU64_16010 [Methylobacterium sp. C25]|uniref:hypothetical protein n=1 Tax=Methylobacterium sp. C25 TaxID=2721622 RepID=UPI001F47961B|nr:hypothetical protein [Methylobacterium sp. C25]MCE4225261.1 hypothetical protein [Methylobacterium sp. C25]